MNASAGTRIGTVGLFLVLIWVLALAGCGNTESGRQLFSPDGGATPSNGFGGGGTGGAAGSGPSPCRINADCEIGVCESGSGRCVECVGTTDCAPGETCQAQGCVPPPPCQQDADCTGPDGSHCFQQTGTCVECISSADCGPEETCDANKFCVPSPTCVNSLDCALGVCDQSVGRCIDCLADPDCPEGFLCGNGDCRPFCDSDTDCKPRGLLCDFDRSYCVECLQSQDCAADRFCEQGACRADLCTAGESKCDVGNVVTCAGDGSGFVLDTYCFTSQSCTIENDVALCKNHMCQPGLPFCAANTEEVLLCADDGLSAPVQQDCADSSEVCVNGACAPVICTPGAAYCQGTVLMQCSAKGDSGVPDRDCALFGSYCSDATGTCEPLACTPGTTACVGDVLRVCDALGASSADTDCTASSERCVDVGNGPECKSVVCLPSQYFCQGGNVHQCAADGQSSSVYDTCAASEFCTDQDPSCNVDVCTAGTNGCSGSYVRTCRADGSGFDNGVDCAATSQVCSAGACVTPVCTANSYFCSGGNVQRCASTGLSFSQYDTCATGEYCTEGDYSCNLDVCTQGQPACNGSVATTCNSDGSGYVSGGTDCAATGQVCWNGACQTPICTPNAYFCVAGDVHRCASNGLSSTVYDNCSSLEYCTDGDSTCNPQLCTPDGAACDGMTATTCNADGSGYLAGGTDCTATSKVCAAGTCQTPVCVSSSYFCQGGNVQHCSVDAVSYSLYDTCAAGEYCTDGDPTCNLDICSQGQPACDGAVATTCNSDGSGYTGATTDCTAQSAPNGPHCRSGVCTDTLFFEDFEDGDYTTAAGPSGVVWTIAGSYTTRAVTTDQAANGTTNSLVMTKSTSSGSGAGIYTSLSSPIAPTTISWWARPATASKTQNYVIMRPTTSTSTSNYLFQHYFSNTGLMTLTAGSSLTQGYTVDTWYHIELRNINWATGTFDYYVDGVARGAGLSFYVTGPGVQRVELSHYTYSATGYWDEIVMK